MNNIHSPEFWLAQWRANLAGDGSKITKGYATGDFWDTRAGDYDRKYDDDSLKRIDRFLDSLEESGLFKPGMRVLDIGCGPGRYAAALARRGGNVTAIDISPVMIGKTTENRPEDASGNVQAEIADWREVNLRERNWERAFDLVFARMTPAINTPEGLERMIEASSHGCYLRAWAEKNASPSIRALWRIFTGADPADRHAPFPYLFNYLLANGYHPSVNFDEVVFRRTLTIQEALRTHIAYFRPIFGDTIADLDRRISDYVRETAVNGVIDETIRGWAADMTWTVKQD